MGSNLIWASLVKSMPFGKVMKNVVAKKRHSTGSLSKRHLIDRRLDCIIHISVEFTTNTFRKKIGRVVCDGGLCNCNPSY